MRLATGLIPFMNPDLGAISVILIVLIAFGSAVLHALAGFGGALVLAVGLSAVVNVKLAVPLTTVAMIISNIGRAWAFRRTIPWHTAAVIFVSSFPFIVLGALLFINISEKLAQGLIGAYLLLTVPMRHVLVGRGIAVGKRGLAAAAVPYGLISGVYFGSGLVLAPFLIGAGILGERLVALIAVLGLGLNLVKTIIFTGSPLLTGSTFLLGLAIGFCTIPGTYMGRSLLRITPARVHAVILEAIVVLSGLVFLYYALR